MFTAPLVVTHIAHDSRGVAADVIDLDYCLPACILRWGYFSQGKGSISSKLQSLFLPSHQKMGENKRKHLELIMPTSHEDKTMTMGVSHEAIVSYAKQAL